MDNTAVAVAGAVLTATASVITAWLRARTRRVPRWDHLGSLPPGSRIVDLGSRGVVIDVGGAAPGPGSSRDTIR